MNNKNNLKTMALFGKIAKLIESGRNRAAYAVNLTMVHTYFEIGRMIVEDEQQGKKRAEYGKNVLKGLSLRLTDKFGKGFSVENLDRMRFFYKVYSETNSSTVLTNSGNNTFPPLNADKNGPTVAKKYRVNSERGTQFRQWATTTKDN